MESKVTDGMAFDAQKASLSSCPSGVGGHRNPEITSIHGKAMTGANFN